MRSRALYGVLRRGYDLAVLPLREVYSILREAGFSALGMPQQRGLIYTVAAIDLDGEDGRLVIDARSGRILRFIPAYRMGDRMSEEIDTRYGPQGAVPTSAAISPPAVYGRDGNARAEGLPAARRACRCRSGHRCARLRRRPSLLRQPRPSRSQSNHLKRRRPLRPCSNRP